MKNLNSYLILSLTITIIAAFTSSSSSSSLNDRKLESSLESNINLFLAGAEIATNQDEAEIYSDFIVKEDGDFYSIDFMLTNDGQVEIISQDYEDEYYIMDNYTTVELKHHIVTVAIIKSDVIYKT